MSNDDFDKINKRLDRLEERLEESHGDYSQRAGKHIGRDIGISDDTSAVFSWNLRIKLLCDVSLIRIKGKCCCCLNHYGISTYC